MEEKSEKTLGRYYWQQRPLRCDHPTCRAGSPSIREKPGRDGLTPFMREQWALAAPGNPRLDMEDVIASLNVTPSQHLDVLLQSTRETWQSFPRTALVAFLAVLYALVVKPVIATRTVFSSIGWPKIYLVVVVLIWIWFTSDETATEVPAPRPRYEKVITYYLVPDVKGWSR